MNFNEVTAEVLRLVKRPDKIISVRREVNSAINLFCVGTNFARDFTEASFPLDSTLYAQNLPLSGFAQWRKFLYLKPPAYKKPLLRLDPDKIFTGCKELTDVYYISGDDVIFKTSKLSASMLVGWFKYPPVLTEASPDFWLLEVSPFMVIDMAASKVFDEIGDDSEARRLERQAQVAYSVAKSDYKYGSSYGG